MDWINRHRELVSHLPQPILVPLWNFAFNKKIVIYPHGLKSFLWIGCIANRLPTKLKVALWNYCFDAHVDWRTLRG